MLLDICPIRDHNFTPLGFVHVCLCPKAFFFFFLYFYYISVSYAQILWTIEEKNPHVYLKLSLTCTFGCIPPVMHLQKDITAGVVIMTYYISYLKMCRESGIHGFPLKHFFTICQCNDFQQSGWEAQGDKNSPSGGDVVSVRWTRSNLPGQAEVCYFHQFWSHAQQILRL